MKKFATFLGIGSTVGMLALPLITHAAADAALVNAATDLSTAVKDNVLGTVFSTAFLGILAVILVGFGIIAYVSRYVRRSTGR